MSYSAAIGKNISSEIIFDIAIFLNLAAAGVSLENIASCFLVSPEELTAELKRLPVLHAAYTIGRGEHLIHMYNTLKAATSPTLIALMARTDGFGQARKPKQAEPASQAEVDQAADAAMKMLGANRAPASNGSRNRAAHAVASATSGAPQSTAWRPDPANTPMKLAERIAEQTERRIRLNKAQAEAVLHIEQTPPDRELTKQQIRQIVRQVKEARAHSHHHIAEFITEQAAQRGIVLQG